MFLMSPFKVMSIATAVVDDDAVVDAEHAMTELRCENAV